MQHSTLYTLVFATIVCLICSIFVSGSAVVLRPRQELNAKLDLQKNVLSVAGLMEAGEKLSAEEVEGRFAQSIKMRFVDLASGGYAADETVLADSYDVAKALKDPALSIEAPANGAQVSRIPKIGRFYQVLKDDAVERIIVPVVGKGLWGTMYGMLALDATASTIRGITFYAHQETPGLGGEVDNPKWKALWDGRVAFDEAGIPIITVVKGPAAPDSNSQIDGLSGATLTSRAVTNLVQFWLGESGFGPYLTQVREQGSGS